MLCSDFASFMTYRRNIKSPANSKSKCTKGPHFDTQIEELGLSAVYKSVSLSQKSQETFPMCKQMLDRSGQKFLQESKQGCSNSTSSRQSVTPRSHDGLYMNSSRSSFESVQHLSIKLMMSLAATEISWHRRAKMDSLY